MRARSSRARLARWLLLALVPTALVLHPLWLGALGDFLVARDELRRADAIVVLAGNSPYRAEHAVELYRAGWAPRVLISNELVLSHGVEVSWLALRQAGLVHLDLPDEAVVPLERVAQSTYQEAQAEPLKGQPARVTPKTAPQSISGGWAASTGHA